MIVHPPPTVRVRAAHKAYLRGTSVVRALDDVSLDIDDGEFVAIVGKSGSGKSTLLNVLGTLDSLDTGSYEFQGVTLQTLDDAALSGWRARTLGFVFQSFHLLDDYTAIENVEMPMVYAGVDAQRARGRALEVLERVGMQHRLDHQPKELSGGQQQRVAIARALANAPRLILADEPTGALDAATTEDILALLRELNDDGVTIVLVTHDAEVASASKRVVRMHDGRIVSDSRGPQPEAAV